jgi:hypothetical protein
MASHPDLKTMFLEIVGEYLKAAEICLHYRKDNGGVLGYPAALMLCCLLDALGKNLNRAEKQKLGKEEFNFLQHPAFKTPLTVEQIGRVREKLGDWFRHKLAHQSLMAVGVALSGERAKAPFGFSEAGEFDTIYVFQLYEVVKNAWKAIDKDQFEIGRGLGGPTQPAAALTTLETPPASGAISGAPRR